MSLRNQVEGDRVKYDMRTRNAWLALVMLFSLIFPSLPVSAAVPMTVGKPCEMKCCRPPEPQEALTPKCHRVAPEPTVFENCKCSVGSGNEEQKLDLTFIGRTATNDLSVLLAPAIHITAEPDHLVEQRDCPIAKTILEWSQSGHVGCWLGRAPPVALG